MRNVWRVWFLVVPAAFCGMAPMARGVKATPGAPVELAGTRGAFGYVEADAGRRQLLVCHAGNGSLDVVNLDTGTLVKSLPVGAAQGVALDEKRGRYFVSVGTPGKVVVVDAATLEVTGEVALPGPGGLVAYHEGVDRVFVGSAARGDLWVVDPEAKAVVKTIPLPGGGLQDLGVEGTGAYLFQNLAETNEVARIDVAKLELIDTWPTAPSVNPRGLVVLPGRGDLLIVGGEGKLSFRNPIGGRLIDVTDIAARADQGTYDPTFSTAYVASATGVISVVSARDDDLVTQAPIPSVPGIHSVAVDTKTHALWIAYVADEKCFVQKIDIVPDATTPKPTPTPSPTPGAVVATPTPVASASPSATPGVRAGLPAGP